MNLRWLWSTLNIHERCKPASQIYTGLQGKRNKNVYNSFLDEWSSRSELKKKHCFASGKSFDCKIGINKVTKFCNFVWACFKQKSHLTAYLLTSGFRRLADDLGGSPPMPHRADGLLFVDCRTSPLSKLRLRLSTMPINGSSLADALSVDAIRKARSSFPTSSRRSFLYRSARWWNSKKGILQ